MSYLSFVLHTLFSFQGAIQVKTWIQHSNSWILNSNFNFNLSFFFRRGARRSAYKGTRKPKQRSIKEKVVGLNGLEPSTSRLSGGRSNLLSYKPIFLDATAFLLALSLSPEAFASSDLQRVLAI